MALAGRLCIINSLFLTTSCLNMGLIMLRCDANTFASAPICGKGACLLVRLLSYSVVCDARLMSITNIHYYFLYRPISFPSLSCIYKCTYLSCRTSLSSLSYLPRKIVEVPGFSHLISYTTNLCNVVFFHFPCLQWPNQGGPKK